MSLNTEFVPEGAVKPHSIAVSVYDQQLLAYRVMPLPSNQQTLIDYVSGTNPIYVGTAPTGFSQAQGTDNNPAVANWMIKKITFDANNNPTAVLTGWGRWNARASTVTYS